MLIAVLKTNVDTEFEVSFLVSSVCHLNAALILKPLFKPLFKMASTWV